MSDLNVRKEGSIVEHAANRPVGMMDVVQGQFVQRRTIGIDRRMLISSAKNDVRVHSRLHRLPISVQTLPEEDVVGTNGSYPRVNLILALRSNALATHTRVIASAETIDTHKRRHPVRSPTVDYRVARHDFHNPRVSEGRDSISDDAERDLLHNFSRETRVCVSTFQFGPYSPRQNGDRTR